ncbi:MAG: 2-amino-4-hydroxy-6-hydroxymethyldihydropteridine diphosphokinase [Acetobacter sp.]|jgi:2-amino-4-hydroxy-6-hydroxymethyldihydropteridine diphosphokinase|uniref:2-amino-4-hydroxy-6-hydroxymethyldihydropteridine pyrophosphokinase n=1 Tax=Acetobacter lovaniensis TaxID=104100 RepID=A0A841QD37_9PROT|nr:2-amino-4-hydroxy-6-hydroxymethyldihydropteridine diphosphokinase [Acetobacter lovaniensis]MBB6456037.1 2-amino-4-hydroxy-6-hydroxymethyldihydropteridine diphosphokinase [Acetobacter lovaniensis]MCI1697033.1 2-amino-4-hydroxy-6-hydroxymethyldihydropteridine diphosphokinase [Acetobacter lovaniensis]MCI1795266.1 2-amino-4-hydroxy-6-hydroxymethyldihydropteridine diphosphokinase [Acetobacter lovaniensis]MCP1238133.1 2-amino-4-hydroxy-6-hydroxymethyldihydropteridine diphosphokinase [Acetobacter l
MAEERNHTRSVLIAIGANLPQGGQSALESCEQAVQALRHVPGLRVQAVSRWYESAPMPPSGQPPYVNGVVLGVTSLPPLVLLDHLQDIETQQGRVRSVPNAARTLDLDIIDMDALCQTAERLVLPHPRAHERAFVLYPLRDVQPGWVHPRTGQPLEQMLQAVEGQEIRVIG